jgi:general secretion pathway protein F
MPRYRYRAYDQAGALKSGEIEGTSDAGVLNQLRSTGLLPVETALQGGGRELRWWERDLFAARALPNGSLALFTRELATLVEAGIPLDEALRMVMLHPMAGRLRATTQETLEHVLEGASLSDAMQRTGRFGDLYCSVVRAGESGGKLADVLRQLASFLERSMETGGRIRSALVYPAILVLMAVGALILIVTVLLPTIAPIFKDAGTEPPFILQRLLEAETFVSEHWLILGLLLAAAAAGLVAAAQNPQARASAHRLLLRLPVFGRMVTMAESARVARTLGSLLGSGVPMLPALRIAAGTAGNAAVAAGLTAAAEEVKEGRMLADALRKNGVFPILMLRLIAVGEETGRLEPMLAHVEKIFDSLVQRWVERMLTLLTPALTIVMGVMVGGLIMSVMRAILSINELALK